MLGLFKIGVTLQKQIPKSKGFIGQSSQIRCLFSRRELGVEGYEKARIDVEKFVPNPFEFKTNFQHDFLQNECDFTKFETGLKNLIYVINNNKEDISTLKNALYKLIQKQKELEGEKYSFGPVVMRALYYLNMPTVAIEFLEDKIIEPIFTQITGQQVLLDLLYEHKMYDELLRIQKHRESMFRITGSKYIDLILFATYYRINTPESFKLAYDHWKGVAKKRQNPPFRRSATFIAGLAVKQHKPEIAVEILKDYENSYYVTTRNIRLLAWTQMGKFKNVIAMFQLILRRHKKLNLNDQVTSLDVLNDIEKLLDKNGSEIEKFRQLRKEIESAGLVTKTTLDDLICKEFSTRLPANLFMKKQNNK